jgi:N-acetylmuramoyl-L-alanine amidase
MTYAIIDDRLQVDAKPARFVKANSSGSRMLPELIIIHDTAGALIKGSSVEWFASAACKTSAHFVIERDGEIVQMVNCDEKAWHAGESSYQGRRYCNSYSIGIELVSPGALSLGKPGFARAYYHRPSEAGWAIDDCQIVHKSTPEHGDAYWMPYTKAQIEAVNDLCAAIVDAYPTVKDVTGHFVVSPRRKIDPCPLFPLADLRQSLFGAKTAPTTENVSRETSNVSQTVSRPLSIGDQGDSVRACQERLRALGYPIGAIDGHFGPQMRVAVLAFEAENGRATDGSLDDADRALLLAIDVVATGSVAKAMPIGAREEATYVPNSQSQADARKVSWFGRTLAAVGIGEAGSAVSGLDLSLLDKAEEASSAVTRATKLAAPVMGWVQPRHLVIAGLIVAGCALVWIGRRIEWRRLMDHRIGAHLGR